MVFVSSVNGNTIRFEGGKHVVEKFNLKDLVNIRTALKFQIQEYEGTRINMDRERETLEKIVELIRRYRIE